ncbi:hypothetical protein AB0L33_24730 [Streptomyces sp. NPDC052299]|uniref:hypothetical protein n=1 Tax=Streptomyces sp. NPDC052299 TaxID=3155054 RepID=UPI003444CB46
MERTRQRLERLLARFAKRPPGHRSPAWEPGHIALDLRTVLGERQGPTGLAEAVAAHPGANPALPAEELLAVPRLAAGYLAGSVYPLSVAVDDPAVLTLELGAYGRNATGRRLWPSCASGWGKPRRCSKGSPTDRSSPDPEPRSVSPPPGTPRPPSPYIPSHTS